MNDYADILPLPHPVSKRHAHMSPRERAAQFMPFAALTGYEALVNETVREKMARPELSEGEKEELDRKLAQLGQSASGSRCVIIRCIEESPAGGDLSIVTKHAAVSRVDPQKRIVVLDGVSAVPFRDILSIEEE